MRVPERCGRSIWFSAHAVDVRAGRMAVFLLPPRARQGDAAGPAQDIRAQSHRRINASTTLSGCASIAAWLVSSFDVEVNVTVAVIFCWKP